MTEVLNFGRWRGHTFEDARDRDPEYCEWVLSQRPLPNNTNFASFRGWLQANPPAIDVDDDDFGFAMAMLAPSPAPADYGSARQERAGPMPSAGPYNGCHRTLTHGDVCRNTTLRVHGMSRVERLLSSRPPEDFTPFLATKGTSGGRSGW
ncbi:unnamed protein product [Vitrella brassicaformis CCMP3155]|uniref:Uncharacterized protein n=1 Tax=Vitrella brassicaformis (strain CCMP3155) TaxID=1169540 RepID=A0A0G4ENN1_VITBC|nr:unnamed protein product [Vitrella brassicaformis CCMP3155]|eukprot:CEL98463.1 unnamed protein product [Vitrella brassicaformis CCMP3155]